MAQKPRAAAKKVKDRWRAKEWYKVYAPDMFSQMQLGETPAESSSHLVGRVTEATVQDLTGDFSKMHIKLRFKVNDVRGLDAHTIFAGHNLTSDYVRRLTRRKRTKTDTVVKVTTKDGWGIAVKPMAVSEQRIQASQETAIRRIMDDEIKRVASESTIGEFVRKLIMGDLSRAVSDASRKIVPIKRIEIRRSEVTSIGKMPSPGEETPINAPEPQEETAAEDTDKPAEEAAAEAVSDEASPAQQEDSAASGGDEAPPKPSESSDGDEPTDEDKR
ncbi:MAG: 30S ribosomal protein S3ae [Methanobacteriota archaeon]|nr:MAG: 30S ribosomal protein S3ae [Euryarchaeota archaeon]